MLTNIESAQDISELTVWIRAGGSTVKTEINSFLQKILQALPSTINFKIIICTNENDTILEEVNAITQSHKIVKVIFSQLSSFSSALTSLAQHTALESNVLTLSVGVNITENQILTGLKFLTDSVKVYGWLIDADKNDGSCPGRGWYNTAALIDKTIVQQIKKGLPNWVDNGALGYIGEHMIGGNEEIPIMVYALQKEPETKFILNKNDPVFLNVQLSTEISFQEKLDRKTIVGQYYMQKLYRELKVETDFESWSKYIWASLEII